MKKEIAHYVVTAHPPGAVWATAKCNFLSEYSMDVLVAKNRRLEVRQLRSESEKAILPSPFPIVLQVPINGRITVLTPLKIPSSPKALVFLTTDRLRYAVISHDVSSSTSSPYPIMTHASGSLRGEDHNILGREVETGPIVAVDHLSRCIAVHIYDGLITIIPINNNYIAPKPVKGDNAVGNRDSPLGELFHCRIEERTVLAMAFLKTSDANAMPQLCVIHQDSRGTQHMLSHLVNLKKQQLHLCGSSSAPPTTEWLKKASVDGGSSLLIPVAPPIAVASAQDESRRLGGVVILGQRQFTFCSGLVTKVIPVPEGLYLTYDELPPDPSGNPRYLIGDEFGNLHMLTLMTLNEKVVALQLDTLGSCNLSSSLVYLTDGLVFLGSKLGDSQLVQIHDEPIATEEAEEEELVETTYLTVVEEYTNLGPILDFDLIPTTPGAKAEIGQSQVVTASGSSKSGSIRLVRNGIGMNEYASVEIPGIQKMWSIRKSFFDKDDAYLVQSFVGETRVLGVVPAENAMRVSDEDEDVEVGGSLEEVALPGLDSSVSSLYVGNVQEKDRILQITETEIRLIVAVTGDLLDRCFCSITVATANEAGQIAVATRGGTVVYYCVQSDKIVKISEMQMEREVSCLDVHPFSTSDRSGPTAMQVDRSEKQRDDAGQSSWMAVGLWDDFTVRLLSLTNDLEEAACINLSSEEEEEEDAVEPIGADPQRRIRHNMMARSLCLVSLDFSSSSAGATEGSSGRGVDMLFVGLGDGTLISFAVVERSGRLSIRSKKEVCLGTQRIDVVPLSADRGGTCVLATGDRPTVIYLAGIAGTSSDQYNPKLCYSNVNLSTTDDEEGDASVSRPPSQQVITVNVAASFWSPLLFDAGPTGNQQYTLCVADDSNLRLGVIDDIQKLHVTTCRLGMAPRRIVHCIDGRLFAVGCIESGIDRYGLGGGDEVNMGNCIRFMDDTTFDDIERVDLEPYEMITSMLHATLKVSDSTDSAAGTSDGETQSAPTYKPFLLVGTAYALPDEDEPTRGRILVYNVSGSESAPVRTVRQVTELTVQGAVYCMCQFYEGRFLCSVNSKTHVCELAEDMKLSFLGMGHHGHILSLMVKSLAKPHAVVTEQKQQLMPIVEESPEPEKAPTEQLAIVGDLTRSISLIQYMPEHQVLEEIARDFNANWCTAVEMLHEHVYLGAENWTNLFCLRRNPVGSDETKCRLDTIGEYHYGEMVNKMMRGSLVMQGKRQRRRQQPKKTKSAASPGKVLPQSKRHVATGSQTLFGTVDGTLGVVLGLDGRTAAFFGTLERTMATVVKPVGGLDHILYRSVQAENRIHPAHGFVDGDLVESFLDLDRSTMQAVVREMNRDGGWQLDDVVLLADPQRGSAPEDTSMADRVELTVEDVLTMVEEMSLLH